MESVHTRTGERVGEREEPARLIGKQANSQPGRQPTAGQIVRWISERVLFHLVFQFTQVNFASYLADDDAVSNFFFFSPRPLHPSKGSFSRASFVVVIISSSKASQEQLRQGKQRH